MYTKEKFSKVTPKGFSLLSAESILSEILLFLQERGAEVPFPLYFCHNFTVLPCEFLCLLVSLYILKSIP